MTIDWLFWRNRQKKEALVGPIPYHFADCFIDVSSNLPPEKRKPMSLDSAYEMLEKASLANYPTKKSNY